MSGKGWGLGLWHSQDFYLSWMKGFEWRIFEYCFHPLQLHDDSYVWWFTYRLKERVSTFCFCKLFHFLQLHDDFSLWYGLKERIGQYIMFLNIVFTFCNYMMTTVFGYSRTAWEKESVHYVFFFFHIVFTFCNYMMTPLSGYSRRLKERVSTLCHLNCFQILQWYNDLSSLLFTYRLKTSVAIWRYISLSLSLSLSLWLYTVLSERTESVHYVMYSFSPFAVVWWLLLLWLFTNCLKQNKTVHYVLFIVFAFFSYMPIYLPCNPRIAWKKSSQHKLFYILQISVMTSLVGYSRTVWKKRSVHYVFVYCFHVLQ